MKKLFSFLLAGIFLTTTVFAAGPVKWESSSNDARSSVLYGTADAGDTIVRVKTDADGTVNASLNGWDAGNVTFVPIGASIADYITAATAGDTLQLAAGTYTITASVVINKKLHIRGMGVGITTITSSTDVTQILNPTTQAGTLISDLTISQTGARTGTYTSTGIRCQVDTIISRVQFLDTTTGAANVAVSSINCASDDVTVNIYDCTGVMSGAIGAHLFMRKAGTGTVNMYRCTAVESNGTWADYGNIVSFANAGTINYYSCVFSSATDFIGGVLQNETTAVTSVYDCVLNGSGATAFDVKRTAGTLTLYNTTLVNNKTSGTITYAGTVASGGIKVRGQNSIGDYSTLVLDTDGAITVTQGFHKVDTFDSAASDDLVTINGGVTGMILVLTSTNSNRDVTVKDGSGNLRLAGDFTFSAAENDTLTLIFHGTVWLELSRSDNA